MKKGISKSQAICLGLLWLALCYIVLTKAQHIDGMTVVSIILSGVLVFVPIIRTLKSEK